MSDALTASAEASNVEQQWVEAQADLRACLEHLSEDGPELRVPSDVKTNRQRQRTTTGKTHLMDRLHMRHEDTALPKSPVDMVLGLLLRAMHLKFVLDAHYRKNIENFTADYVFRDKGGKICQVAHFANGKMHVSSTVPKTPTLTLTFSDGKALMALLLSPAPDVLDALLNQKVDFEGNINYLNKFAFMAMRAKPHF